MAGLTLGMVLFAIFLPVCLSVLETTIVSTVVTNLEGHQR